MSDVVVYKLRTTIIRVNLGIDVSGDTITSQIREGKEHTSTLIGEWDVTFDTDGVDGKLRFTLDDSEANITQSKGYMDIKRVSGGEPLPVFSSPIKVLFKEQVTE
jgi:hypothetical protein